MVIYKGVPGMGRMISAEKLSMSFVQGEGVYQQSLKGVKQLLHADHVRKLEARDAQLTKRCEQLGAMAELHRVASRKHEVVNSGLKKELQAVTALHMQVEDSHQQAQRDIKALQASLDLKGKELRCVSEELQSKSKELHAKHKELHTTNEMLQSKSKELHAKHKELQSKNEELNSKCRELNSKFEELKGLHGDLNGLRKSHEELQRKHRNTSSRMRALQQKLPALRESLDVAMLAVERGSEDSVRQCLSHLCNVVEGVHGELLLAD